jgi:penicillin-binding protein 2
MIPDRLENKPRCSPSSNILGFTPEDLARIATDLKRAAGFQPVQVRRISTGSGSPPSACACPS